MHKYLTASLLVVVVGCSKKPEDKPQVPQETPSTAPAANEAKAPAPVDGEEPDVDPVVARGRHIAKLAGCQFCHTPFGPKGPDMSKTWAGGLEVPEPFGTWRSPNITPHQATGIGSWTDEQIKAAIRQGVRPDGAKLFPIMPYPLYNKMSDEDADALVAYLKTLPAIEHAVERAADLKLPYIPVPPPATKKAPDPSDTVAHGEYLATLMHCVMCHTPMNKEGNGFDMSRPFAGGYPFEVPPLGEGVLYSSNLTPHETGIKGYTDQELADAITKMQKKDGSVIQGPMALYQGSWFDLPEDDVNAVVAFLRTLPPIDNKVPPSTFKPHAGPPPGQGAH